MKRFMLKSFLLVGILFMGVLIGMQQAQQGLHKMRGYDDPAFKSAFTVEEREGGEIEASILGQEVTSHDLEQKKQKLEQMKAYNFFSSIGKKLTEVVSSIVVKVIDTITG